MAHYNNLGKRGQGKGKNPRKGPCVRIVLHILILILDILIIIFT